MEAWGGWLVCAADKPKCASAWRDVFDARVVGAHIGIDVCPHHSIKRPHSTSREGKAGHLILSAQARTSDDGVRRVPAKLAALLHLGTHDRMQVVGNCRLALEPAACKGVGGCALFLGKRSGRRLGHGGRALVGLTASGWVCWMAVGAASRPGERKYTCCTVDSYMTHS
ncbi:hypothetical protein OAO87_02240 [bacterium]|nr:hypothetical protein [bacterium]